MTGTDRSRAAGRIARLLGVILLVLLSGLTIHLGLGQWNRTQARSLVHQWGGSLVTTPRIPDSLSQWMPQPARDMFWNVDLVAFNDRSCDPQRLTELTRQPGLRQVRRLYLNGTGISDQALSCLENWPYLEELYLEDTAVSDAGLSPIGELPSLRIVSLRNTRVTSRGVAQLQHQAPHLEILGWMNLRPGSE